MRYILPNNSKDDVFFLPRVKVILILLVKLNTLILYSYFHIFISECDVLPMHRKKA